MDFANSQKNKVIYGVVCALCEFDKFVKLDGGKLCICPRCQQRLIDTAMEARAAIRAKSQAEMAILN